MDVSLLKPVVRPVTRLLVGLIAVPTFRALTRRVIRQELLDDELQKDLEQWFRGALILLVATQNMESALFPWARPVIQPGTRCQVEQLAAPSPPASASGPPVAAFSTEAESQSGLLEVREAEYGWVLLGLRVMLAISVIQMMPDQELFAVVHGVAPKLNINRNSPLWPEIKREAVPFLKGHVCLHLNKSSPVFAILAAIAPGWPGWICYTAAITQYLIIGLITTRDKAITALSTLDREAEHRRQELIEEFHLEAEAAQQGGTATRQGVLVSPAGPSL
jgi:hypothetical protein